MCVVHTVKMKLRPLSRIRNRIWNNNMRWLISERKTDWRERCVDIRGGTQLVELETSTSKCWILSNSYYSADFILGLIFNGLSLVNGCLQLHMICRFVVKCSLLLFGVLEWLPLQFEANNLLCSLYIRFDLTHGLNFIMFNRISNIHHCHST